MQENNNHNNKQELEVINKNKEAINKKHKMENNNQLVLEEN